MSLSYTSLNVRKEDALNSIKKIGEIQYWANELDLTGTAAYYMINNKVEYETEYDANKGTWMQA